MGKRNTGGGGLADTWVVPVWWDQGKDNANPCAHMDTVREDFKVRTQWSCSLN